MKSRVSSLVASSAAGLLIAACGASPSPSQPADAVSARAELQAASLSSLFYSDAPRPPRPTQRELDEVRALIANAPADDVEVGLVKKLFGTYAAGMAWAHRDTDGDGIFDFRVSHYDGKFFEGDVDLDGDGIRNTVDEDPYDPAIGGRDRDGDGHPDSGFTDANDNGVPDHVDFAIVMKGRYRGSPDVLAQMVDIQERLYRSNKIILVERDAEFTPALAQTTDDTINRFYRKLFVPNHVLPTLRTIASEKQAWLKPDGGETCAMMFAPTGYLAVYGRNIKIKPLFLMGLLVHEIAHSYQYSLDRPDDAVAANRQTFFPMRRFLRQVEPFGWTANFDQVTGLQDYHVFSTLDEVKATFLFQGETAKSWQDWLTQIQTEKGDDYLKDSRITPHHIVGDYSMTDPLEWHADNLLAYFMTVVEDGADDDSGDRPQDAAAMKTALAEAEATIWPGFQHANIRGGAAYDYLAERFPQKKADIAWLVEHYLRPLAATR